MALRAIVLVGLRGAGKTTIGRALAAELGWQLFDSDERLGAAVGKPAGEWLAEVGEGEFRRREEQLLLPALATARATVVATGGGAVTIPAVREALADPDLLAVWLAAPTAVLVQRAAQQGGRPPLTELPPAAEWEQLRREREPFYRAVAQLTVDTAGAEPSAIVATIAAAARR